jgi:hypothetical protein
MEVGVERDDPEGVLPNRRAVIGPRCSGGLFGQGPSFNLASIGLRTLRGSAPPLGHVDGCCLRSPSPLLEGFVRRCGVARESDNSCDQADDAYRCQKDRGGARPRLASATAVRRSHGRPESNEARRSHCHRDAAATPGRATASEHQRRDDQQRPGTHSPTVGGGPCPWAEITDCSRRLGRHRQLTPPGQSGNSCASRAFNSAGE